MSVFERLLKFESIELPACRCGRELDIDRIELVPGSDGRVRIYQCQSCGTELRLPEAATTDEGKSNINTSTIRNDDRRAWAEVQRREMAEDRKIGQIILGSLAALALLCGLIIAFSGKVSNIADRGEPMNTGSTGTAPTGTPPK